MSIICVKCRTEKDVIKKYQYSCGTVDPQTGELDEDFGRHRYKPYSEKELAKIEKDEIAIMEYYEDFARFNGQ